MGIVAIRVSRSFSYRMISSGGGTSALLTASCSLLLGMASPERGSREQRWTRVGDHDRLLAVDAAHPLLPHVGRERQHDTGLEPLLGSSAREGVADERQVVAEAQAPADRHR